MFKITTILTADELLDKAFHRASKVSENPKIKNKIKRRKKIIITKFAIISDVLDSTLNKYISSFPSFDRLHKFEYELINITIGVDKLRKSLGAIDWARKQVRTLNSKLSREVDSVRNLKDYELLERLRRMFYGRTTSIINQVKSDLNFLNQSRNALKKLPTIDPELKTIVVAGFPNVGKSLLVKHISTAEPIIAKYPFTTKHLNLGHMAFDNETLQIIDTPGLLDRSMEDRNKIELEAIMALEHLSDLIIFILDPSEHCGYTIDEQNKLLSEIKEKFQNIDILVIENKVDIIKTNSELLKISAEDGSGITELLEFIRKFIKHAQDG